MTEDADRLEEIAIIGMAGRFPGAKNITQFWENLANGVESISRFSDEELISIGVLQDEINKPNYVKAGTILNDADLFDASFFGYSEQEAKIIDPQQRIFLETAWEAMESAGYNPDLYNGVIGVFAGASGNDSKKTRIIDQHRLATTGIESFGSLVENEDDFLTSRVSNKLNLTGPSLSIQTACSTSLVAVHHACQNLLTYKCDIALSGGVCFKPYQQGRGYLYQEGMIWSKTGHCRPFDSMADGTIFGSGVGIIILKRLSEALKDRDNILAVIKGSAVNNDGSFKAGFTAPSVEGQAEAVSVALAISGVDADSINYIETHGTATPLGDPIEIEALTLSFREYTDQNQFCAIGSVKSNIGHLDASAGVAGLIKTVLAMQNKKIPATLHFKEPNPHIDFSNSPFYVNNTLIEWEHQRNTPRRAGVSSFGIGGTNAHVILEEAPETQIRQFSASYQLLPISAKTKAALQKQVKNLIAYTKDCKDISLSDVAYTLQLGRKHFNHRKMIVCKEIQDLSINSFKYMNASMSQDIVFMFSGQASQYVNMCRGLYLEYPVFKRNIDQCSEKLLPVLGMDIRNIIYPPDNKTKEAEQQISQTSITQPVLFTIEYALSKLWNHFGIFPSAMVGHSIGEFTAACISGVFSLDDALNLVTARGKLMQSLPFGSMLAIPLPEKKVVPYLSPKISLAVLNGASMSVVSGETYQIEALAQVLSDKGIESRILHTSHAFHSAMMDPVLEDFKDEVLKTERKAPTIPFVSNITGTWITEKQAKDPAYWAKHLRQTVRFFSCANELLNSFPDGTFLEVGPGQVLAQLTRQHPSSTQRHNIIASTRRPVERKDDLQYFLNAIGQLWLHGLPIEWSRLYKEEKCRRIPLPTYPFDRSHG